MSVWQELESIASIIKHDGEVDLERVRVACRRAQEVIEFVDQMRAGRVTVWPPDDDDDGRRIDVSFTGDPSVLFQTWAW